MTNCSLTTIYSLRMYIERVAKLLWAYQGPPGLPLASRRSLCCRFCLPRCLVSSPVGPYQVPHQFVQIAGEERPGTCHLQRLPQTFFGLVEPIFVGLECPNDPFGFAALAPDRLADGLGNVPRPVAFGLDANLLDPLVGERPYGCRGIATPVVDHQRGRGLRAKDRAVPRQRLQGHL